MPGDATWVHSFFNTTQWTKWGGDFRETESASQDVAGKGPYEWASTEMRDDVQDWLDFGKNFGWLLKGNETTSGSAKRFDSRSNNLVGAIPPMLTVQFTLASLPSDLTNNGFVDFEDLTVLLANWNQNVTAAEGNLVDAANTPVNFEDLTVLLADWTGPGPAGSPEAALATEAVPEPSSLALAVLGLLSVVCCRRRRRP